MINIFVAVGMFIGIPVSLKGYYKTKNKVELYWIPFFLVIGLGFLYFGLR